MAKVKLWRVEFRSPIALTVETVVVVRKDVLAGRHYERRVEEPENTDVVHNAFTEGRGLS